MRVWGADRDESACPEGRGQTVHARGWREARGAEDRPHLACHQGGDHQVYIYIYIYIYIYL